MKFKKQVMMEVAVGIFSFAMILVLLALTTVLSQEMLFRRYYTMVMVFDSVADIGAGHAVMVRGVPVGKVTDIWLEDHRVHLKARLDQPLDIHEGYHIEIKTGSLIGGNIVNIHEGDPSAPRIPADTVYEGHSPVELMGVAAQTVSQIQRTLNDGVLENLQASMENIREVTARLGEGDGLIGRLLTDDALYGDIEQIAANLRELAGGLARGEGTIGRLLTDDEVYTEVQAIAANLRQVTDSVMQGEGVLGRLVADDGAIGDDLAATLASVRSIAETIARGEGTVGRLISDDEVYEEFKALVREGRATVDDIRETSPITTFTSILFGAF